MKSYKATINLSFSSVSTSASSNIDNNNFIIESIKQALEPESSNNSSVKNNNNNNHNLSDSQIFLNLLSSSTNNNDDNYNKDEKTLNIEITAKDIPSLRAAINSYLRLINLAYSCIKSTN